MKPQRIQRKRTKGWRMPDNTDEERRIKRQEANNLYRRKKRAEARAKGDVYRKGRGNPQSRAIRNRNDHIRLREELFSILGCSCARCGFDDKRALQLDHRQGGGGSHRKSMPSGTSYLRRLATLPNDEIRSLLQILCANCNTIKRIENGEHRRSCSTSKK